MIVERRVRVASDKSSGNNIDLTFIATLITNLRDDEHQAREDVAEMKGSVHDNLNVNSAMLMRMDGTMQGMAQEVRAPHSKQHRVDQRVGTFDVKDRQ